MVFIPATCPSCGGNLQVPDDREKVKCMYCGADIVLSGDDQVQKHKIDNYLNLARAAEQSDNHPEAYKYFSLVLEADPGHVEAWVGKGTAAGWQSTLASPRLQETVTCFEKALGLGLEKSELRSRAADAAHHIAKTFFEAAKDYWRALPLRQRGEYEEKEYCLRVKASLSLIHAGWLIRPNLAMTQDMDFMCIPLEVYWPGDPMTAIKKQCEEWIRQNDPDWAARQRRNEASEAETAAEGTRLKIGCVVVIVVVIVIVIWVLNR